MEKPDKCRGCPLYHAKGPVWGDGPTPSQLLFLGEAPGPDECRSGRPFTGAAGAVFSLALKAAGIERSSIRVTNVVKCMPPRKAWRHGKLVEDVATFRTPMEHEIAACMDRWWPGELATSSPNLVVALGATALNALIDMRGYGITEWRGYLAETETLSYEERVKRDDAVPF